MFRVGAQGWPWPAARLFTVALVLLLGVSGACGQYSHDLSWRTDLPILGTGIALHIASRTGWQHPPRRPYPDPDLACLPRIDRKATQRWSPSADRASDRTLALGMTIGLASAFFTPDRRNLLVPAVIMGESVFLTAGLTNTVKRLTRRPRPYMFNPERVSPPPHRQDDFSSFWSGHTANTAALTFSSVALIAPGVADRGTRTGLWIGAATVPALVGYLRVRAGKHFPTDVVAGFAVGALVGLAVPYLHQQQPITF
jgi:membrane-associated phospholipid phosphatase